MSADPGFARLWFAWRQLTPPVARFREGAKRTPTYELENALDHLVSSVYALGAAHLGGAERDPAPRAAQRLAELEQIAALISGIEMSTALRTELTAYVHATRAVLQALGDLELP